MTVNIQEIPIRLEAGDQVILGQSTFNVLSIELIYQAVVSSVPHARLAVAICEGSDERLIRFAGNDRALEARAAAIAQELGCGHVFAILLNGAFPLQILSSLKNVATVLNIIGATGNTCSAIVARSKHQGALLGLADGYSPERSETSVEKASRRTLVQKIGYTERD